MDIVLSDSGGLNVITRVFISERERQGVREGDVMTKQGLE